MTNETTQIDLNRSQAEFTQALDDESLERAQRAFDTILHRKEERRPAEALARLREALDALKTVEVQTVRP